MAQMGMDHEQHHNPQENGFSNDGWAELGNSYNSPQHQSPTYEYGGQYGYMSSLPMPAGNGYPRMAPPPVTHATHQQQLLPLIMPNHPTWPSMLTNPASFQAPPVAIPPPATGKPATKLPAIHATPTPRKTLTDSDRRRMCQYHEDNPTVKQTEIGAMFGVERSTVSKVLRQREKYLFPEDRALSPVKRAKGKFPDIERALSNWVRNSQKQGIPLTDAAIKEKAKFFATTVGNNESHIKTNSTSWLEKFKQKNGIGGLRRRASETNIHSISERMSLGIDPKQGSRAHTPNGISPASPNGISSPHPLASAKSSEDLRSHVHDSLNSYFEFSRTNNYKHSNSQSTTSLSSAFTDTAPSSFSGGPTSPTTPFAFSPDGTTGSWMPSQHARVPQSVNGGNNGNNGEHLMNHGMDADNPASNFQRPRSQTFPTLAIDPSFISSQGNEPVTPKFNLSDTAPSSAVESPVHELGPAFTLDSAISPRSLHHSSSNSSMAPPPASLTPISGLQSPPHISAPSSPTQDDARRALDTLLNFFQQAPNGLVDQNEYMTVLKLTEKLRLQQNTPGPLPGGLHRISEQEGENHESQSSHLKMEQSASN
ncbi:centromere binding b protein [Rutstroemia sp. NJR-2017a BBW]|nr:centromere binding b protein [Rutstroemia sp. NJR-2017a BBW]